MKKILYTIMLVSLVASANAQTSKRSYMIGANLLSTSVNFQNDNTGYDLAMQPKIGYFLNENLVIGLSAELGVNVVQSNTTMNYGLTPFARIFIGKENINDIPRRMMFFIEAGAGFGGRNSRFKNADGSKTNVTTNGAILYAGPGVDMFLTRNVALELGAEYRHIGGSPEVSRVGINLGFQVFLSKADKKKMQQDVKSDVGMN